MNISSQTILKLFNAGGFETERHSVRNGDFSFRRKAQVRTYLHINFIRPYLMQRRHHQGEEETKARAKNGFPLPPDGFSSALLFLTPLFPSVFYPPTFRLPPCPNPIYLFALTSIATFTGSASLRSFICGSLVHLRAIL